MVFDGGWTIFGCLEGQHFQPPFHNAIGLGKETVAADVYAIAFVVDGAGNAAHTVTFLKNNGLDIGAREEFVSGS